MATKLDSPSTRMTTISSSSKVSKFGAKIGFVIPKNKLSGSLVPTNRGGTKVDKNANEESTKQISRNTKWGVDLTQDSSVRKARAMAYQIRLEQITQLLNSGPLETEDDHSSCSQMEVSGQQSASNDAEQKAKRLQLLELERRELIGEILRLNPSFKAPPDYKPLLKEEKVSIPIKAYPGYNFIGLLLGPESNSQKRLEKETGAKIRVYGTKENSKEKREITQADISEAQAAAFDELYVNVSADTYEKVDAAVSLIKLLLTPVSSNAAVSPKDPTPVASVNNQAAPQPIPVSPPWFPPHINSNIVPSQNRPQMPIQVMQQPPPQNQLASGEQFQFMASQPMQPSSLSAVNSQIGAPRVPLMPQRPNMPQMPTQPFNSPFNNIARPPPVNFTPVPQSHAPQPSSYSHSVNVINRPPVPSFTPVNNNPSPRFLRSTSGDFSFQTQKSQIPELPITPTFSFSTPPQPPPYRPGSQNPNPTPFPHNPTNVNLPPRFQFSNSNNNFTVLPRGNMPPTNQMGPLGFSPSHQVPPQRGQYPNYNNQHHHNQLPQGNRPGRIMIQNQQIGSNPIYDPFSPTSAVPPPLQQGGLRKQEPDAEYEDLMASVGVK